MKKCKFQNRSKKKSQSCVPLKAYRLIPLTHPSPVPFYSTLSSENVGGNLSLEAEESRGPEAWPAWASFAVSILSSCIVCLLKNLLDGENCALNVLYNLLYIIKSNWAISRLSWAWALKNRLAMYLSVSYTTYSVAKWWATNLSGGLGKHACLLKGTIPGSILSHAPWQDFAELQRWCFSYISALDEEG